MQLQRQRPRVSRDTADFVEYQRTRDRRLRDRLVNEHIGLAYSTAGRFAGRGEEVEDLRQVALVALVHAVERFDPSRGLTFATYATPTISGSLKRHFRDRSWAIRPSRPVQERFLEVTAAIEQLTGDLQRSPRIAEIADYGNWTENEVHEALVAGQFRSLAHPRAIDEDSAAELGILDRELSTVEDRDAIAHLLDCLGERERDIVKMRFFEELGQAAIARRVGVSQMHVCRLLKVSMERLRTDAECSA